MVISGLHSEVIVCLRKEASYTHITIEGILGFEQWQPVLPGLISPSVQDQIPWNIIYVVGNMLFLGTALTLLRTMLS